MANKILKQKLVDSTKRALTKVVLVADGSGNETNTVLIDVSTLNFALNANGYIMQSGVNKKAKYNTTIKRITGTVKTGGSIRLQWHGDSNSEIIAVGTGSFDINFENMVDGGVITNPEANSSGNILISTTGLAANDVATIFIDQRKDAADYDAGQTADPYAFNSTRGR